MFVTIKQFQTEFIEHATNTQNLFNALTDESLDQRITEDHRSLGELALHIIASYNFIGLLGLSTPTFELDEARLSAEYIQAEYNKMINAVLRAVVTEWKDKTLKKKVSIMGDELQNGAALRFIINHSIHHCGQMTVLMRQAGLRIPGLYGPTSDDWVEQGETPPI
ncbi:DinB family protein [Shimazuella sp. AN120528]|uniref:DinB family protein n=1 Tax=Shimazuella soli TaxID=1892854 RepID=UPI001F0D0BDC|nr:DinB family protein [Shimazuella soli]MCH5585770.1 DinB family protein [Shimazuella soli]